MMTISFHKIIKTVFTIGLCVGGYFIYRDGLQPYLLALKETDEILTRAAIPLDQKGTDTYRRRALHLLEVHCKNGVKVNSPYDFRCLSNSNLPSWFYLQSEISKSVPEKSKNDSK